MCFDPTASSRSASHIPQLLQLTLQHSKALIYVSWFYTCFTGPKQNFHNNNVTFTWSWNICLCFLPCSLIIHSKWTWPGRGKWFSVIISYVLSYSCVPTILWLQGHARRVGLYNQKQLPTHFQKLGVCDPVWERHLFTYCSFLVSLLPYRRQQCSQPITD
jgi:hypothetical protein